MRFTLDDIAKAIGASAPKGAKEGPLGSIGIDTRHLEPNSLFVAIPGAHYDGHDFLGDAHAAGAKAAVVRRGARVPDGLMAIEVEDTVRALGEIASWWRGRFTVPCVAITGSNGKSTTKEMIASIAGTMGPVLKTEGNFNNLIGLPLTVFRWDGDHMAAILEMGMNAPGEILRLAEIARPDVGLITNVTAAHLEKLHTVEAVARAKGELFQAMDGHGVAVVNAEDRWVREMATMHTGDRVSFGMQNDCDVKFMHMETDGWDGMDLAISVRSKEHRVKLPVTGVHNVMNALAAIATGIALGIESDEAIGRLSEFHPMAMRLERVQLANGVRVVNDSYNANPESMRAAFRTAGAAKRSGRFLAALGDMLELGEQATDLHVKLGEDAVRMGVNEIFTIGDFAQEVASGARSAGLEESTIHICDDADQLCREVEEGIKAGDVLLVKGSRGMRMERLVDYLKREIGTG